MVSEVFWWERENGRQKLEELIRKAKWNMYIEKWDIAKRQLAEAGEAATSLDDKRKLKEIIALYDKCGKKEKVDL